MVGFKHSEKIYVDKNKFKNEEDVPNFQFNKGCIETNENDMQLCTLLLVKSICKSGICWWMGVLPDVTNDSHRCHQELNPGSTCLTTGIQLSHDCSLNLHKYIQ